MPMLPLASPTNTIFFTTGLRVALHSLGTTLGMVTLSVATASPAMETATSGWCAGACASSLIVGLSWIFTAALKASPRSPHSSHCSRSTRTLSSLGRLGDGKATSATSGRSPTSVSGAPRPSAVAVRT